MPHEPRHASMARCVSMDSMTFFLVKSHSVSTMRTRGSSIDATRSRVSSSDLPTLTTTSSQTASTDSIAGTIGKSSLTAFRTSVNPDSTSGSELQVVQAAVETVPREEMVVTAALHDPAFGQHDDEVRMLYRGEPMRDHEYGAMRHQPLDGLLHQPLRFGVERARRFVENQNRRIAQERARDRDALALAAAEPGAALTEQRAVAFRQAHDEFVRVRRARGHAYLLERHVPQTVGDVRKHAVVEQHRLLRHDAHQPPQRRTRVVRQRDAIEQDCAARRLVEARQQVDERGLPGAGRTDDRDHLSPLHFEIDVTQHG